MSVRRTVVVFPGARTPAELDDIASRIAWHFPGVADVKIVLLVAHSDLLMHRVTAPPYLDQNLKQHLQTFVANVDLICPSGPDHVKTILAEAGSALVTDEEEDLYGISPRDFNKHIYRVDPKRTRQEGSFYVQAAYDSIQDRTSMEEECRRRFKSWRRELDTFQEAWILATGPSVEKYTKYEFENRFTVVCNSVVLNTQLLKKVRPNAVAFADPIFHFGVSRYASEFRAQMARAALEYDLKIIIPFKYYPLFIARYPELRERTIGIPMEKGIPFNLDLGAQFRVRTTANILTLLLLPVAATFARNIRLLGCDGRPLEENDYFWTHGQSVQINSEMENIRRVHPGFFAIDYDDYYFDHCHTLNNLIQDGESAGHSFQHPEPSHIPALKMRGSGMDTGTSNYKNEKSTVIAIEPDGLGVRGHYVSWHNELTGSLAQEGRSATVICNVEQNPDLYDTDAYPRITSHSWAISRADWCFKRGFSSHPSYMRFRDELKGAVEDIAKTTGSEKLSVFVYYGSTQILAILQDIRKDLLADGIDVRVNLCLFHEGVILRDDVVGPRFPPGAREILLKAVAQAEIYNIQAVTPELADEIQRRFEVRVGVQPNPIPRDKPDESDVEWSTMPSARGEGVRIVFPGQIRAEKGASIVKEFAYLMERSYGGDRLQHGWKMVCRTWDMDEPSKQCDQSVIEWLPQHMEDSEYRRILRDADVIVLPYTAPHFSFRTSGIIVDALKARTPCVVIEGTWLANVVRELRVGLVIRYKSAETIRSAIRTIQQNRDFFERQVAKGLERYQEVHSWKRLASQIL